MIWIRCSRLALIPRRVALFRPSCQINRTKRLIGTLKEEENEEDQVMREFFEQLKRETPLEIRQQQDENMKSLANKDPAFSLLMEFMKSDNKEESENGDDEHVDAHTAEIAELKMPVSELARQINCQIAYAETTFDLKLAIDELTKHLIPCEHENSSEIVAAPKLIATAFAKCRKFQAPTLAYSLYHYLKTKPDIHFISWMTAHAFNELVYMEWEQHHNVKRVCQLLDEFHRGAVIPNSYTLILLKKIRNDIEKWENFGENEKNMWNENVEPLSNYVIKSVDFNEALIGQDYPEDIGNEAEEMEENEIQDTTESI